jgi:hypothetical protein
MATWVKSVTQAVRSLRKQPAFALTAIFTLALGIGATAAIFSVVDAVLLQPLLYRDADRLVHVAHDLTARNVVDFPLAPGDFHDLAGIGLYSGLLSLAGVVVGHWVRRSSRPSYAVSLWACPRAIR